MSLLVRRCLNRSHQLEQYVETWQIDRKEAMYARDLEELVKDSLEVAPLLRRAWNSTIDRLFDEAERSERVFAGEEVVRIAINRVAHAFRMIAKLIQRAERSNYSIDGAPNFTDQLRDLELLEKEVEAQWPPLDSEQIRESMAAYERGESKSAQDILRELQGDSPVTN